MGTTEQKLALLANTKEAIRTAITDKGVDLPTSEPFSVYPEKIASISAVPKVKITIRSNLSNVYFNVSYMNAAIQQETVEGLGVGTYEFPIVTAYPVSVQPVTVVSGYGLPNIKTKSVVYDSVFQMDYLTPGVYLQANDLSLYTAEQWDAAGLTHGDGFAVVIVSSTHTICISPYSVIGASSYYGGSGILVDGVVNTNSEVEAVYDFNGFENTNHILAQVTGTDSYGITGSPAANFCRSKKTPLGVSGYFPALGELNLYASQSTANVSLFLDLFSKLGFSSVEIPYDDGSDDYRVYVSSTQRTKDFSHYISDALTFGGIAKYAYWDSSFVLVFYPFLTHVDCTKLTISSNMSTASFTINYVSVSGDTASLTGKAAGDYYLPVDLSKPVTVTASLVSGYDVVLVQSKYLSEDSQFTFTYTVPGVFIRHINGSEFTTSQWTAGGYANSDADCVVIRSGARSFGISLATPASLPWLNSDSPLISGVAEASTVALALMDFDGANNTAQQLAQAGDNAAAAKYCNSFVSPGGLRGYFPSAGEFNLVATNYDRVNEAFIACGGHYGGGLIAVSIWTSTQVSERYAWVGVFTQPNTVSSNRKIYSRYVVPFLFLPN